MEKLYNDFGIVNIYIIYASNHGLGEKMMNKMMKKMGMRGKLIFVFLLVSIVPILIIGSIAISKSVETMQNEVGFYSKKTITLMGKNIDMMVGEVEKDLISLMSNQIATPQGNF